jgi:dipeptidyl-peptidase III
MKIKHLLLMTISLSLINSVGAQTHNTKNTKEKNGFEVINERFADLQVLRYEVPGFNELTPKQKELAYYLYEAALCGRDMIWDQRYKHNLAVRKTIEAIYNSYKGDRKSKEWKMFDTYAKRVWFSNGIHHHYSNMKFVPECGPVYFKSLVMGSDAKLMPYPLEGEGNLFEILEPVIFQPELDSKLVDQANGIDNVALSSNNFYGDNVTQNDVDFYYNKLKDSGDRQPEWGLNTQLVKDDKGNLTERTWKVGGMYTQSIEKIVYWLNKAVTVAENAEQKDALEKLIKYYKSGDVHDWDTYNIAWVKDVNSRVDVVNGFIEVYLDAIGKKGSFESVVSIKDMEASKRIETISKEAQWFEDHSPIADVHKKKDVKGITAKVITVIVESGDGAPSTPIGINLPNNRWVREDIGSKSVSLGNIVGSYNLASAKSPVMSEFAYSDEVAKRMKEHGVLSGELHTDMHEVIGHASGQREAGVEVPSKTLKQYASTLEEARADLVALYYIMDQKLVDIGVMPSLEVGFAEYDNYIMNGLIVQLTRLQIGEHLEEAHMRNRQLIAKWAYEKGKADNVIEWVKKENGKTYVKINDYTKLRALFGELLKEIQRVVSQGDFEAGKKLVEDYGVQVDQTLLKEVLERFKTLDVAPYKGFIQPKLVPVMDGDKVKEVKIEYPTDFAAQMLEYGKKYGYLPVKN